MPEPIIKSTHNQRETIQIRQGNGSKRKALINFLSERISKILDDLKTLEVLDSMKYIEAKSLFPSPT
jgi:hypothetical protein